MNSFFVNQYLEREAQEEKKKIHMVRETIVWETKARKPQVWDQWFGNPSLGKK
jgi:hypothetical protein